MLTSIRELLNQFGFDWETGVVISPAGEDSQNVILSHQSPVLDIEFDLSGESPRWPMFTAEDEAKIYLLVQTPKNASFFTVPNSDLEDMRLGGMKGFPYGPNNHGVEISFENYLDIFITVSHEPAIVGCPEIHLYVSGDDRKEAMDLFTLRVLAGYLNVKLSNDVKGYAIVLRRMFQELQITERIIPPIPD